MNRIGKWALQTTFIRNQPHLCKYDVTQSHINHIFKSMYVLEIAHQTEWYSDTLWTLSIRCGFYVSVDFLVSTKCQFESNKPAEWNPTYNWIRQWLNDFGFDFDNFNT